MRRFTETQKWKNKWFRKLKPEFKLAWIYICEECDNAGVIDLDVDVANLLIGFDVDWTLFREKANDRPDDPRILEMRNGKWWIVSFVDRQNPSGLNCNSPPKRQIVSLLRDHGLLGFVIDAGVAVTGCQDFVNTETPQKMDQNRLNVESSLSQARVKLDSKGKGEGTGKGSSKKKRHRFFEQIFTGLTVPRYADAIDAWFYHAESASMGRFTLNQAEQHARQCAQRPEDAAVCLRRSIADGHYSKLAWDKIDKDNGTDKKEPYVLGGPNMGQR